MNAFLTLAGLFALTGAMFLLPLIPAVLELRRKRDAKALNVIQQYAGDIRHFSFGFRSYAADLFDPLKECVASGGTATGTLPHGDRYLLLGRPDASLLLTPGSTTKTCDSVVLAGTDLTLPGGMTFEKEIFASRDLNGGENCTYRAILGDSAVHLSRASSVTRWAHAGGSFHADEDCDLYGRISSDREIELHAGCVFQRLNAPRIAFVSSRKEATEPHAILSSEMPPPSSVAGNRRLVDGDLKIGPGEVIRGSIVTRGSLHVGSRTRILGSVKSHKAMTVDAGAFVAGSLISVGAIHIGSNCRIAGPIIAERGLSIGAGTHCGTAERPTTVSAPVAEVEDGVVVFGTIWARHEGQVIPHK